MDDASAMDVVRSDLADVAAKIARDNTEVVACDAVEMARMIAVADSRSGWKKRVFWISMALGLRPSLSWDVPTMATDGTTMYYNPDFTMSLSDDERYGVVIGHEPMHGGMQHFSRMMNLEHRALVNICQDAEINPILAEAEFILPDMAIFPGKGEYKCLPLDGTAEEYYEILTKEVKAGQREMPGKGDGAGASDPGGCGTAIPAPDAAAAEAMAATWRGKVAAATHEANRRGDMPGRLKKWVGAILDSKLTWQEVLLDFMITSCRQWGENCWSRPSRRSIGSGLFLPSRRAEELPEIVISVDVSGSTIPFLEAFSGELNGMLACNPARCHIVYSDTKVQKVEEWEPGDDPIELEAIGGGGTSHTFLAEWVGELEIEPACVIALTDGDTRFGNDPGVPVIWALTKEKEVPFGRKVLIV